MNEIGVALSTLYESWHGILPSFLWLSVNLIIIFIAFLSGKSFASYVYKQNIKYCLPKIAKEEIDIKDKKIKILIANNTKYRVENGKLKNHIDAIIKVTQVMDEVSKKKGGLKDDTG